MVNHSSVTQILGGAIGGEDRNYYNDMPGKVPPDVPEKLNVNNFQFYFMYIW